jgi:hypothetical protein
MPEQQERVSGRGERHRQTEEQPVGELGGDEQEVERQPAGTAVLAPAQRQACGADGEDEDVRQVDDVARGARPLERRAERKAEQAEPELERGDRAEDAEPPRGRRSPPASEGRRYA